MTIIDSDANGITSPGTYTPRAAVPTIGSKTYDPDLNKWRILTGYDDYGDPVYQYLSADHGGGGSGPDHFFDISPVDRYNMDRNDRRDARDAANDDRKLANDDRSFDYNKGRDVIGDARDTRNFDYNKGRDARSDYNSDRSYNLDVSTAANNYNARVAEIAVSKQDSDNRYAIGIANAQNDAERNNITQRWNEEQARIAKMEDETKMILGQQANQTGQFGAETERATGMGRLALDNNKFIADMASGARGADLFSLYFMQRGLAPDFNAMAAGGQVARGDALAPSSVMHAYDPVTAPPTFNAVNSYKNAVGNPANAYTAKAFVPPPPSSGGSGAFTPPAYVPPRAVAAPSTSSVVAPKPPGWSGIRNEDVSGLTSGQRALRTTGSAGTSLGGDYTNFKVYNPSTNQQYGAGDVIGADTPVWLERLAEGGFTNAQEFVAGDANDPNPNAGGAKPERIFNPTGAPFAVLPHPDNNGAAQGQDRVQSIFSPPANPERRPLNQAYEYQRKLNEMAGRNYTQGRNRYRLQQFADYGQSFDPQMAYLDQINRSRGRFFDYAPQPQRFALGTQGEYEANGMGSSYIPSSTNDYLANTELPPRLKMLRDRGMPIAPSLAAAATGGVAPTLNMGAGFAGQGAGTPLSLQGLRNQTKGETELYKGYVEGVNKIPWADYVDWIGKPTEFLRGAARSVA